MTEAEACALLLSAGHDQLDHWIAEQLWRVMPGGWWVGATLRGWHFRVEVASASRLRLTAFPPDAAPAIWLVPGKAK
jgi:hypothetical protein